MQWETQEHTRSIPLCDRTPLYVCTDDEPGTRIPLPCESVSGGLPLSVIQTLEAGGDDDMPPPTPAPAPTPCPPEPEPEPGLARSVCRAGGWRAGLSGQKKEKAILLHQDHDRRGGKKHSGISSYAPHDRKSTVLPAFFQRGLCRFCSATA